VAREALAPPTPAGAVQDADLKIRPTPLTGQVAQRSGAEQPSQGDAEAAPAAVIGNVAPLAPGAATGRARPKLAPPSATTSSAESAASRVSTHAWLSIRAEPRNVLKGVDCDGYKPLPWALQRIEAGAKTLKFSLDGKEVERTFTLTPGMTAEVVINARTGEVDVREEPPRK
jgi:hypothetical protein